MRLICGMKCVLQWLLMSLTIHSASLFSNQPQADTGLPCRNQLGSALLTSCDKAHIRTHLGCLSIERL